MKIFVDSADAEQIAEFAPIVQGITTNPTLMRRANVQDYAAWAKDLCAHYPQHAISFEVIADAPDEMERQAVLISQWGPNVFVKIPFVNSEGIPMTKVIRKLSRNSIPINITALMDRVQVKNAIKVLEKRSRVILSVFAGRIADTGLDPASTVRFAVKHTRPFRGFDVLWASPRQILDLERADRCGADIITLSPELLRKLAMKGKDLQELSRETSKQFYEDAQYAGYSL